MYSFISHFLKLILSFIAPCFNYLFIIFPFLLPSFNPCSIRINQIHWISGAVGVGAGGVVLLGEGVGGEPAAEDLAYFKEPL